MAKTTDEKDFTFLRLESGQVYKYDLPLHETLIDQLRVGRIREVADLDGTELPPKKADSGLDANGNPLEPKAPGLPTTVPAKTAVKLEWVGWAVANGMPLEEAEALNKDQLVDKFGLITVLP